VWSLTQGYFVLDEFTLAVEWSTKAIRAPGVARQYAHPHRPQH
jgi:hypothetical protein